MSRRISETIYFVRDMDSAIKFYVEQAGFNLQVRHDWGFAVLSLDGAGCLALMLESAWEHEYPDTGDFPRPRIAIQTDDFEKELERMRANGIHHGQIRGERGSRRSTTYHDYDENPIYLWFDPEESMEESVLTPSL